MEEGDIFKQFQSSFSKLEGHFHILEQRIPMDVQMAYFKHSGRMRGEVSGLSAMSDKESEELYGQLLADVLPEEKKEKLTKLAVSKSVKAYRLLERYTRQPQPDPAVADWAYMALMESRMSLESELLDEKQIYISSGLGGCGEKLRFFVLLLPVNNIPFQEYQRQVVEREFNFFLPKNDCDIERLTVAGHYVELLFLVPVKVNIKTILDLAINECNQYGDFLSEIFTITNVKELTREEIETLINKNGSRKASN